MRWFAAVAVFLVASASSATPVVIFHEDGTREVRGRVSAPPMLEYQVAPVVPDSLWPALRDTAIVLILTISESGVIDSVQYAGGETLLYQPAAVAVRQWRYSPALRGTVGVEVRIPLPLELHPSKADGVLEFSGSAMTRFKPGAGDFRSPSRSGGATPRMEGDER